MATVEPEELKKKTKMVAYDTLSNLGCASESKINQDLFCTSLDFPNLTFGRI
jgi:hypothetical protein